jgi:FkbM family methyltransferase
MENYKESILHSLETEHNNRTILDIIKDKKVVVYGAGAGLVTFFNFVLKRLFLKNITAILDLKFKAGDIYHDIPAFSPHDFSLSKEEANNTIAIITSGKQENYEDMISHLQKIGIKDIMFGFEFFEYNSYYINPVILNNGTKFYNDNKNNILSALDLLEDDLSKEVYTDFVNTFIEHKVKKISSKPNEEQYFPKDIKMHKGVSRFIDCGAYTGDTLMQLNERFGKIDEIICFEPDKENFKKLNSYINQNHSKLAREITLIESAVYSHKCKMNFSGNILASSAISEIGEDVIKCISIDDTIADFEPTLIKMDIECAEPFALIGAEKTIRKYKPDLAICVYHLPNHIWEIPLWVNNLDLGYKFYIRNYMGGPLETIMYATAE